jgi:hypothetical protein
MKIIAGAILGFAAMAIAPPAASAETVVLRALDKTYGVTRDIQAPVGKAVKFGTLSIVAKSCSKRAPEETPEISAYLEIHDTPLSGDPKKPAEEKAVFSGWMFWSSPALNALDHPSYDVWVMDCKT